MKAREAKGAGVWVLVSHTKRMALKQKEPGIFTVVRYPVGEEPTQTAAQGSQSLQLCPEGVQGWEEKSCASPEPGKWVGKPPHGGSHQTGRDRWENNLTKPLLKKTYLVMFLGGSQGIPPRFRSYGGSSFVCGNTEGLQGAMIEPFLCKGS